MSMSPDEKAIRDLLKGCGATFRRKTGKGRECWALPNGATFFFTVNSGDYRAHKNNLADLRRILGKTEPEKIVAAANIAAEKEAATARIAAKVAALQIPITVEPTTLAKWNEPKQTTTAPDGRVEASTPKEEQQTMGSIELKTTPVVENKNGDEDEHRTRWTDHQDRELESCYRAKLSLEEMVQYMQDCRPGCTASSLQSRTHVLKKRASAFGNYNPRIVRPELTIAPTLLPTTPAKVEADLVRVVFEFGDKKRVVYVDQPTEQNMLAEAARLA